MNLNIRNVPKELMEKLRIESRANRMTIRQYALVCLESAKVEPITVATIRSAVDELRAAPQMPTHEVTKKLADGLAESLAPKKKAKHFADTW